MRKTTSAMAFCGLLAACANGATLPFAPLPVFDAPQVEKDASGRCFGRDVTPAVIETVTEQVLVRPPEMAADGSVTTPASFRTVTRQEITQERREVLFETICPEDLTPEFVASLQRALQARGHYRGPISGVMDASTALAIKAFQRIDSHDSPLLDIETARRLGLIALTPEQLGTVAAQ